MRKGGVVAKGLSHHDLSIRASSYPRQGLLVVGLSCDALRVSNSVGSGIPGWCLTPSSQLPLGLTYRSVAAEPVERELVESCREIPDSRLEALVARESLGVIVVVASSP